MGNSPEAPQGALSLLAGAYLGRRGVSADGHKQRAAELLKGDNLVGAGNEILATLHDRDSAVRITEIFDRARKELTDLGEEPLSLGDLVSYAGRVDLTGEPIEAPVYHPQTPARDKETPVVTLTGEDVSLAVKPAGLVIPTTEQPPAVIKLLPTAQQLSQRITAAEAIVYEFIRERSQDGIATTKGDIAPVLEAAGLKGSPTNVQNFFNTLRPKISIDGLGLRTVTKGQGQQADYYLEHSQPDEEGVIADQGTAEPTQPTAEVEEKK